MRSQQVRRSTAAAARPLFTKQGERDWGEESKLKDFETNQKLFSQVSGNL
jgi:hypothetical protein